MKNSSILLALFIALVGVSCDEDPVSPSVVVTPNTFVQSINLDDVIEYSIEGIVGDAELSLLVISTQPEGGVTSVVSEEELSGISSNSIYTFELENDTIAEWNVIFTITDTEGRTGQTSRLAEVNDDPIMVESTGHEIYSNFSIENTNGFNITGLEPLVMASLADSTGVDLAQFDATDDETQENSLGAYSGIKFTRNNLFNYGSARQSFAGITYDAGEQSVTISDLQIDDILITRYDTLNMLHAVIKIINIQDMPGTEEDRIIFNLKK